MLAQYLDYGAIGGEASWNGSVIESHVMDWTWPQRQVMPVYSMGRGCRMDADGHLKGHIVVHCELGMVMDAKCYTVNAGRCRMLMMLCLQVFS